jgi:hypothetical protein
MPSHCKAHSTTVYKAVPVLHVSTLHTSGNIARIHSSRRQCIHSQFFAQTMMTMIVHAVIVQAIVALINSMLCVYTMHAMYLLSLTVYFSHIDNALHAQQRTHSSSSYTMLSCSCLCYDTLLTNALLDDVVVVYSTAWDQSHRQWHTSVNNSIGDD